MKISANYFNFNNNAINSPYKKVLKTDTVTFSSKFQSTKYDENYCRNDIKTIKIKQKELSKETQEMLKTGLSKEQQTIFKQMAQNLNEDTVCLYVQSYKRGIRDFDNILDLYNKRTINSALDKIAMCEFGEDNLNIGEFVNTKMQNAKASEQGYFDMIFDLVKDEKLSPAILADFTQNTTISRRTKSDLDKLYEAYMNNQDVVKKFVPQFKDAKEAAENLTIGDVCQIGDNKNISIKTQDDKIEDLFLTAETYFELFSPVERFSCHQALQGDCYLLSALDSVYQNPHTRHLILKLFKENSDGTVDMCWRGWKKKEDEIIQNSPTVVVKDIEKLLKQETHANFKKFSEISEGFRALEILNGQSSILKAEKEIESKLIEYEKFGSFTSNGETNLTQEEQDLFYKIAKQNGNNLVWLKEKNGKIYIDKQRIKNLYIKLQDKTDDISVYTKLVIENLMKYFDLDDKEKYFLAYDEILPLEVVELLEDKSYSNKMDFYNNGGYSKAVFNKIALPTVVIQNKVKYFKNELFEKDINKRGVFTISEGDNVPNNPYSHFILPKHCYSLEAIDTNEGRKFIVRNPHNANNELILSYEELEKYFNSITFVSYFL